MEKSVRQWKIEELQQRFYQIRFPEYQREPNLWHLTEKQRLIDSIVRQFDVASLYFYRHSDGSIDCVDGRQRLGAIMSFLGEYSSDDHANFRFQILNEIYQDVKPPFVSLQGMSFSEIKRLADGRGDETAKDFVERLLSYRLTVVMLSRSRAGQEFNLQFTRLNLGVIINSGEKLNAMVGDLRDECFDGLGTHAFLENTNIPTRRFAREQVAAQILAQIFSLEEQNSYTRTRHFDLQRIFKQNSKFNYEQRELVERVEQLFELLQEAFKGVRLLRNRAITVSTVLLAWELEINSPSQASRLARFIEEFLLRLSWQVRKRLLADQEYHYLLEFQRHITQASAERSSVDARADLLEAGFDRWKKSGDIEGDDEWMSNHPGKNPSVESRK